MDSGSGILAQRNDGLTDGAYATMSKPQTTSFNGEQKTAREIAAVLNLSERAIHYRIKHGLPLKSGRLIGKGNKPKLLFDYQGEKLSIKDIAERTGILKRSLHRRLCVYNWPIDKAVQQSVHHKVLAARVYTHNGITDTLRGWSKRVGIRSATLETRLRNDWPLHLTLTIPTNRRSTA